MRHGFLLIDKPVGPTSHDIVAQLRRLLSEQKMGHLGTLDPQASGLLVVAVGSKALKVVDLFKTLTKEYIAEVHLGAESTTYDFEGSITQTQLKPGWQQPADSSRIQTLIAERFLGKIEQRPPQFSALNISGKRAYELAREGKQVEMPLREVQISQCDILSYNYPKLSLQVACSSGTYIRSLAHDIGIALRCGGYLSALRRTKVGKWKIEKAIAPKDAVWTSVVPLKEILSDFPRRDLSADEWKEIDFGRTIKGDVGTDSLIGWVDDLPVVILEASSKQAGMLKARKVL
ncbi:MAG: tRNA pseudouridine(55) synthase TruB [Candidatus Peribacteraceae bacterium]|nr:tRNA pseudouridine(55) synthase TruB [Candidatus Peribacteraceae bacterium]